MVRIGSGGTNHPREAYVWWLERRRRRISAVILARPCRVSVSRGFRCSHQSSDAHQVVGSRDEIPGELRPLQPNEPRAAEPADRLHPAENLLNQWTLALTDRIADVPCGAPVDRAASSTRVLGDVRPHLSLAQVSH